MDIKNWAISGLTILPLLLLGCTADPLILQDEVSSSSIGTGPKITRQPTDIYCYSGNTVTVSISVEGDVSEYIWYKDNMVLASQNTDKLMITAAAQSDVGDYHVVVTNDQGSTKSSSFRISVVEQWNPIAPEIQQQPESEINLNEGESFELTASASGVPTPTYQWYKNGTAIQDATNPVLNIENPPANDNPDTYSVTVTNEAGSVSSNNSAVRIYPRLMMTRYYSPAMKDHQSTTSEPGTGYTREGPQGYFLQLPRTGTVAVYECLVNQRDHMLSKDSNCEGHLRLRTAGQLWREQGQSSTRHALYRCRLGTNHFASRRSDCEGQTAEHLIGYVE